MQWKKALSRAGYEAVGEAIEWNRGVEMARELEPDIILMALNMPGQGGVEATRRIMEERPVPIIVLTAYSDDKAVDEALDAGACSYLVKPIVGEQLVRAIKAAVARFETLQDIRRENKNLRDALEARKLVERAKGIVMERKRK
jgi:AmiR/NasT family two-component response regulator